ncbi:tail fiber domain-containing protein [uncultured Psychroserpens sp.]|uniref:tail fiber domain-containing protein n=1 Tax=uncultured Psychroserpens sp. TaxID=255436 RepID=UPI00260E390C|nr:tail fiber domain-containing protein [uncultured Psychroserpens sp.]
MKSKFTILILLLTCLSYAQNGINYKAVIKDNIGNVLVNENIFVQFAILEGGSTNVYTETHAPTTDENGIIIINIGEGTPTSGNFSTIDWGSNDHSLNVQINTGSGFVDMGTTEFKSVPYAKVADKAMSSEAIELPYYDNTTLSNGAAFHIHNTSTNASYGLVGTTGSDGATIPANRAGVLGYSTNAHGVYGFSKNSFYAGVQGVSESVDGVGVQGYGFGGGVGGHFYTTLSGTAALTTGQGNVGIGVDEPEEKMHVAGNLLIQSNVGALLLGFPDNGNLWRFSTTNAGADLLFRSKPSGSNSFSTRFKFNQSGEFQIGTSATPSAWAHIRNNSGLTKPHLKLEEIGNDYARLELTNDVTSGAYWHVAGLPSSTAANARLNFYFRNASGAGDKLTITGDGKVGVDGTPTARLELYQKGQAVGTGLRFDDGTANSDWDITHGFSLRFHYGGNLRGFINANTGAYTQSSDATLKSNIINMDTVLAKVNLLRPTSYFYKSDSSRTKALGFIAQEVKSIFPEVVHYSQADNLYGIDYGSFSVIAIKAIQEQQALIDNQQKQIDELKSLVQTLINKQ